MPEFIVNNNIKTERYSEEGSSNSILMRTVEVKISRKNKKQYYERKDNELVEKYLNEEYFFVIKFSKKNKTAYQNGFEMLD